MKTTIRKMVKAGKKFCANVKAIVKSEDRKIKKLVKSDDKNNKLATHEGSNERRLLLETNAVERMGSFYRLTILWGRRGERNSLLVTIYILLFFPEFRRKNCAEMRHLQTL